MFGLVQGVSHAGWNALPGWRYLSAEKGASGWVIKAACSQELEHCPKCQSAASAGSLVRDGRIWVSYLDLPIEGVRARVKAHVQRYRCRACGKGVMQHLVGMEPGRRMTARLAAALVEAGIQAPMTHVARNFGCDEKTVRRLLECSARRAGVLSAVVPQGVVRHVLSDGSPRVRSRDLREVLSRAEALGGRAARRPSSDHRSQPCS